MLRGVAAMVVLLAASGCSLLPLAPLGAAGLRGTAPAEGGSDGGLGGGSGDLGGFGGSGDFGGSGGFGGSESGIGGAPTDAELDLLGKMLGGTEPIDVVWRIPDALPTGWKYVDTESAPGVTTIDAQPPCIVQLQQPMGVGTEETPTAETIAEGMAREYVSALLDVEAEVEPAESLMLTGDINGGLGSSLLVFSSLRVTAPKEPGFEGLVSVYRAGDFALTAFTACGGGSYAEESGELEQFVASLGVDIDY